MKKSNLKKYVVNTTIGAVGGFVVGALLVPARMAMAATAPISYPLMGAIQGNSLEGATPLPTGVSTTLGGIIGGCMIPLAPINLVLSPITAPVEMAIVGAGIGAIVAREDIKKGR